MQLAFHGGDCCGVKHIFGLGFSPEGEAWALDEWSAEDDANRSHNYMDEDCSSEEVWDEITDGCSTWGMRWYYPKRPAESSGARLKAYLEWADKERNGQVIEITLGLGQDYNQRAWVPFIEKLGFRLVTLFENSNSGNTVGIWHRVTGEIPLTECPRPAVTDTKKVKPAPFAR